MDDASSVPFLEARPEGLFIDLERVDHSRSFLAYVDELFRSGRTFRELNYEAFHGLLYDLENFKGRQGKALLAKGIADPSPERTPLYHRFRIGADAAHYEFGPLPIAGEDGRESAACITFDELVAAAWGQQIRFGLAAAEIRQRIGRAFRGEARIAAPVMPVNGEDARLEYLVRIQKDLTPVEDPKTGRLDLKRCKCSFPRLPDGEGCRIVRKFPATRGTPGVHLNGNPIPPRAGSDIDLKGLAGEGTGVVVEKGCEYLVANGGGYVTVNPKTRKISVTSDPENHSAVGPETGSIEIRTDHFTQCGDILNGYSVKCRGITATGGNISGEIISEAGAIDIQGTVSAGRLIARNGPIRVRGFVSLNAYIESLQGEIVVERAENATLIGKSIAIGLAVNCNIIGESITVGTVRSSRLRGLAVTIENAETSETDCENTDIIIPILEMTDKRVRSIALILEEKQATLAGLEEKIATLKENEILQAFLQALKAKNEQAIGMLRRHATPIATEIGELTKEGERCRAEAADIEKKLALLEEERRRDIDTLQRTQRCVLTHPAEENLSLKLYGGLDWPLHFERLAGGDEAAYGNFIDLVNSLTIGLSNYKRRGCVELLTEPCSYDHFALLRLYEKARIIDPSGQGNGAARAGQAGAADLRECRINVVSEEDFRCFMKERKWPPKRASIEVLIDGLFKGYVYDFSTSELSMLVEKGQKWRPAFTPGERLKLVATVFGNELKYDLIVSQIEEKPDYLQVLGNFVNISTEDEDRLYKLKNRYEVMRKSAG